MAISRDRRSYEFGSETTSLVNGFRVPADELKPGLMEGNIRERVISLVF